MIQYKYSEDRILKEVKEYIDSTYNQHYSTGNIQAAEYIFDQQQSIDYLLGNVIKYASRFGKKDGKNPKDLMKVIHYGIIALHFSRKLEETKL